MVLVPVLGFLVLFATLASAHQDFSKVEIKTTKLAGNLYGDHTGGNANLAGMGATIIATRR